jgi:hypothetical protein
VRAVPALEIQEIESAPNDVEQERFILQKPGSVGEDVKRWRVYDPVDDASDESGGFAAVMLHYAVNRPVGAKRGESDLAPVLRWLTRYGAWLEDRIRLNRFRQTFVFVVKGVYESAAKRLERQREINANPPNPGSILVTDESETWDVIQPKLDSFEASLDGMAVKKLIAVGAGVPLHFLAEPESSTRTTAEQAGGPTFRHYTRRQLFFSWMMQDIAGAVARRRAMVDHAVREDTGITVSGAEIGVRDNATLASAAAAVVGAFTQLHDAGLISDAELVRMAYKFGGEIVDVGALLRLAEEEAGKKKAKADVGAEVLKPASPTLGSAKRVGGRNGSAADAASDADADRACAA